MPTSARHVPRLNAFSMTSAPETTTATAAIAPGTRFGNYRVIRAVGVGGMGTVFEGVHELLSRRVAIKTLHTKLAEKSDARERFLSEARSVARIRHPNVVEIFDVGVFDEQPYLVMEYLEGESLDTALTRMVPMTQQDALSVVLPIAAALAAVHRAGLVHRDVKPENVFLAAGSGSHFVPKLVDFGIAKDLSAPITGSHHTVIGTPHFMSPEQARGSLSLDARTDQYSFGVMLYQLVTGAMPFDGASIFELVSSIDTGAFAPPSLLNASLSPEFEAVLLRAMSRNAADRFASMVDFGRALIPFASERARETFAADFGEQHAGTSDELLRSSEMAALSVAPAVGVLNATTTLDKMMRETRAVDAEPARGSPLLLNESSTLHPASGVRPSVNVDSASGSGRGRLVAALGVLLLAAAAAFVFFNRRTQIDRAADGRTATTPSAQGSRVTPEPAQPLSEAAAAHDVADVADVAGAPAAPEEAALDAGAMPSPEAPTETPRAHNPSAMSRPHNAAPEPREPAVHNPPPLQIRLER